MEQSLEAHEDGRGNVPALLNGGFQSLVIYHLTFFICPFGESFGAYRKLAVGISQPEANVEV